VRPARQAGFSSEIDLVRTVVGVLVNQLLINRRPKSLDATMAAMSAIGAAVKVKRAGVQVGL
jgi:hypothetical protein